MIVACLWHLVFFLNECINANPYKDDLHSPNVDAGVIITPLNVLDAVSLCMVLKKSHIPTFEKRIKEEMSELVLIAVRLCGVNIDAQRIRHVGDDKVFKDRKDNR